MQISTAFYKLVYEDEDPAHAGFKVQFTHTDFELAVINQVSFFVQKFGGPQYYGGMVKGETDRTRTLTQNKSDSFQ